MMTKMVFETCFYSLYKGRNIPEGQRQSKDGTICCDAFMSAFSLGVREYKLVLTVTLNSALFEEPKRFLFYIRPVNKERVEKQLLSTLITVVA